MKAGVPASILIIRRQLGAVGVEETLQYQHGGDLVDDLAVAGKRAAGGVEMAMGFGRGQALVPEVDGEREGGAQSVGEGMGFGGLGANIAGHVQRIAQNDGGAPVFAEEATEGLQVGFDVPADESQDRLRGEPEFIGDGDPDAAVSEIKAKEARRHRRMVARVKKGRTD